MTPGHEREGRHGSATSQSSWISFVISDLIVVVQLFGFNLCRRSHPQRCLCPCCTMIPSIALCTTNGSTALFNCAITGWA